MTHPESSPLSAFSKTPRPRPSAGQAVFCLMSTFCLVLILRNAEAAIEYMGRGLILCATTVIPSLFPFMVLSELLVSSGAGEAFGRLFSRMMRKIFSLSGAGASAVFLGSMCGFPVGARTAVALLDKNAISKAECEHLLTFVNNPSSAFLVTAVGISLYGNRKLGITLYGVVLGCGLLVGLLSRFLLRKGKKSVEHPHFPSGLHIGGVETFTGAISSATTGMLTVCAYVIFFSAVTGALSCAVGTNSPASELGYTLFCGLLEMTGGIGQAATLSNRGLGLVLTAAFAGWSGISVHCQIIALCSGRGISFKPYLLAKAVQGGLCALVTVVILQWNPSLLDTSDGVVTDAILAFMSMKSITFPIIVTDVVFVLGWIVSRARAGRR